jgi:PAS domain S-box-containing protein
MALPLVAGEVLLGVLDVQSNQVGRFTEEDARLKNTLAAQAAVALQNARLFADQERMSRSLNERVKELNCLNEIGRAVAEAPETDELLEWVTERVPPAMPYPEECVAAIEYEGSVYGVAETLDLPCQMAHALRVGGEVVGRVYIAYRQKREFLNEESALLGGITSRLSGYLESRRLLAQVQAALEEVEQSQEFLRTVIDSIPLPVFIIDVNDVYLGCNKAFLEYVHRSGEDIVGKSIYELYDKEVADQYHEADQQIYHNPGVYQFEVNIQRVDGSPATLIYNRATFTHRDGSLAGQVATILDITERKAVEESLLRNETQLSEALQLARLAYWEFDVETQMFTFNDQLYELFGTTAEEQGGYQVSAENFARKFIHPDEAATVGIQIQQALETTDPDYTVRFESRTVRGNGQEGYIVVQLKVAKDEQGQTVKLYGTNQDITEQKLAELEREQLLAEIEAAYRQYVRHEWEQFMTQRQAGSWRIEHQVPGISRPDNISDDATVVPINLRGQPIGTISLQDVAPNHHWTEDDQTLVEAVSEQLALTVENLRLFSATQQQAVREHLARQITDKMRSAPDVDSIIQTGLNELAKALGAARAYVRLSPKLSKSVAEAEAETPDIEAIRSQLKHNGHKPPAASSQLPDRPADTTDAGLAGKVD